MSYTPTTWKPGDVVSSVKLNKLENGLAAAADGLDEANNALIVKTNTVNLIGTDITKVYPCYIPPNTDCVLSTSDGSTFVQTTLLMFGENGEYLNSWTVQASHGNSRVIPGRNYTVCYVCLTVATVPLMLNIGSSALPYTKYKANLDAQLAELMELKQTIENGYIEIGNFIAGQRGSRGELTGVTGLRCTTYRAYTLAEGDSIAILSVDNGLKAAIAGAKNGSYTYDGGWKTEAFDHSVSESEAGAFFVNIAKVDGTELTPADILTLKVQIRNSAFAPRKIGTPIVNALSNVAWNTESGQSYIDAVESAFNG